VSDSFTGGKSNSKNVYRFATILKIQLKPRVHFSDEMLIELLGIEGHGMRFSMILLEKIRFEVIVFLFSTVLFQLVTPPVEAQVCNKPKPASCKQWDVRSCRCMVEEFSQRYDARDLPMTEDRQTADGKCKARLNGTNGCYTLNGGCQTGPQFCRSQNMCQSNMPRGANYWNGTSCQSTPVQQERQQAKTCPSGQKPGKSTDESGKEIATCVCTTTEKPPEDGSCVAKTEPQEDRNLAQKCAEANGDWMQETPNASEGFCKCDDGSNVDVRSGSNKCKSVVAETKCKNGQEVWSQAPGVGSIRTCICNGNAVAEVDDCNSVADVTPQTETEDETIDRIARECGLSGAEENISSCGDTAYEAVEKCEKKNFDTNESNLQMKGVLNLMSGIQQKKAVESADPEVCGKAAYGATAAYWALDAFKTTCEDKVKECKSKCNPLKEKETFKQIMTKCERMYNEAFGTNFSTSSGPAKRFSAKTMKEGRKKINEQDVNYRNITDMRTYLSEMEREAERNLAKCETDAVAGEDSVSTYLTDLLTASVSAAQCKNAASSGAARCVALQSQLSPAYCLANPLEPCCAPFLGGNLDCNNKDYSHQTCVCARTPDAGVCKTTTVGGGGSQLTNPGGVAALAAPGGITSGATYKPSGVIPQGGLDLGADDPSKIPQGAGGTGGATNPFGVAGGGGGGGGGGLPNSPNDGQLPTGAGQGEGSSSSTSGGPFNQLKTWADKIMGGGSGSYNGRNYGNAGKGKDPKKGGAGIDPNKWRPGLRGVAGGSEFGPRNKDIWKTMNAQYGIQNHTFLGIDGK
jgi:hypothetical protein